MWRFFFLLIIAFVLSCSPKSQEELVEVPPEKVERVVKPNPLTPCTTLDQLSGYIREEVETAFVLYRDQIKLNNIENAYPLWQKAFYSAPGSNGKVKYHFDDGIKIFTHFFQNETDNTQRAALVDSVVMVYEKRVECFGDEAYVAGRKGFDYYYTFNEFRSEEKAFQLLKENIDTKREKADYFVINPFTKLLFDRIVREEISYEEGRNYAKLVLDAVAYGKENCKGRNCEAWDIIEEYAPIRLEALEGLDGFWDCEYYSNKYYSQFEANPEDCETIELVYRRLLRGACSSDDPKLIAVKAAKDTKCYTPPPPPGPLKQAFNAYNEGDYRNAVILFEKYVEGTDDVERKSKYLLLIAKIYYRDLKDYSASRRYALKAAELKDNWGEPYMLIGKLYASSGPLCGPGRGWDSQIVTWPAIDKFQYAMNVDPSVASEANDLIRQYRQYMPKKEDIFFRQLNAGDSFYVGCWIQENTRIRTAD